MEVDGSFYGRIVRGSGLTWKSVEASFDCDSIEVGRSLHGT